MIRFINLSGQGTGHIFAFWDTGTNSFLEFNYAQAWQNWDEFKYDFEHEEDDRFKDITRFKSLVPLHLKPTSVIELQCFHCNGYGLSLCGINQQGTQMYVCKTCHKKYGNSCKINSSNHFSRSRSKVLFAFSNL